MQETINNDSDDDLFCLEDNEHFNELSCNKGTFDDEIFYYLDKANQDYGSHKVCNDDLIAKSHFYDLSANNSPDNISINHSSSSTISSKGYIIQSDSDKNQYSDNLLVSRDIENDHQCNNFLVNGDTSDDHNQSYNDEHILCKNDNDFLGSGDHTYSNESINIVTIKDESLHKCESLGSGERIQIDNLKNVNDDKSVNDNPYELNFLGSCDPTTMVQAVVLMKGLDACFMPEGNLVSFVGKMSCNLRNFIVNGWPNSKTDVPVSKLCHWFLQDELGYYSGILMKGS